MKAVRLESIGEIFLREVPKPAPGPEDLLVRVEACGICGTDRHLLHGEFPCTPPVTLGHEFYGIIETMGTSVSGFAIGQRITGNPNIHCGRCDQCQANRVNLCRNLQAIGIHRDGGFADFVIVPQKQAYSLPSGLDPLHGAFCEPLACCIHGVDMAGVKTGASVVVLGGGVIGLLTVQLARLSGAAHVVLVTGDGSQTRSFCYCTDLIDGIFKLSQSDYHEPVNIGNPREMTIKEFGEHIIKFTGTKSSFDFKPIPVDDPKVRRPDITLAKKLLGWEPKVSFEEGIAKTIEFFRGRVAAGDLVG